MLDAVLKRVSGLRAECGLGVRILIQKMDVKSVDPDGASRLAYHLGQVLFVDFRLQCGWRGSPGG